MEENIMIKNKFCDTVDNSILKIGHVFMWCYGILIFIIIIQVILRYGFRSGLVSLEELQWHLYAVGIMLGGLYAMVKKSHIRVDIYYARFSKKWKLRWNLFGIIVLLLPFLVIIFYHSIDFVYEAWKVNEHSNAPTGLPWVWIIKSFIPLSFGLIFLAAISRLIRIILTLRRQ